MGQTEGGQDLEPATLTLDPATLTLDPVTLTLDPVTLTLDPATLTLEGGQEPRVVVPDEVSELRVRP